MQLLGRWYECHDGVIRPMVLAEVLTPSGLWRDLLFLIDTGADRTELLFGVRAHLFPNGEVGAAEFQANLRITASNLQRIALQKLLVVASQPAPFEYCTLGRDILDDFTVIVDRPRNVVALLTPDHPYSIPDT